MTSHKPDASETPVTAEQYLEVDLLTKARAENLGLIRTVEHLTDEVENARAEIKRIKQLHGDIMFGSKLRCAYCNQGWKLASNASIGEIDDALKAHVEECKAHPLAAARAELAALKEQEPVAWMIEQLAGTGSHWSSNGPKWYSGNYGEGNSYPFTENPNAAVRFPTKESAEFILELLKTLPIGKALLPYQAEYAATDHMWLTTNPRPAIPDGWKPIETAPEDIQILIAQHPSPLCWVAYRHEDGWYQECDEQETVALQPTHWMPLPAAPSPDSVRAEEED